MSDGLINMACNKYNNIVTTKECSKYNPKYSMIAAITTRVKNLEGGESRGGGVNQTKNSSITW